MNTLYPASVIWQTAIFASITTAIAFFWIGFAVGRVKPKSRFLNTKDANKPVGPRLF